jgi:hypothetical protein
MTQQNSESTFIDANRTGRFNKGNEEHRYNLYIMMIEIEMLYFRIDAITFKFKTDLVS